MTSQLAKIVQYIDKLKELDTTNVPPTVHAVEISNVLRTDTPRPSLSQEQVLSNAPARDRGFFTVPKVIESQVEGREEKREDEV